MVRYFILLGVYLCVYSAVCVLGRPLLSHSSHAFQDSLSKGDTALKVPQGVQAVETHGLEELSRPAGHRGPIASNVGVPRTLSEATRASPSAVSKLLAVRRLKSVAGSQELLGLLQSKAAAAALNSRASLGTAASNSAINQPRSTSSYDHLRRVLEQKPHKPRHSGSERLHYEVAAADSGLQTDSAGAHIRSDPDTELQSTATDASSEVAGVSVGGSNDGEVLLMGIKVAPIPAMVLLNRFATGNDSSSDLATAFSRGAATAAASHLGLTPDHVSISLQSRLEVALQLPGHVPVNAAAGSSSSTGSSSSSMPHSGAPSDAAQALAEFLEDTAGTTNVLVTVNMLELDSSSGSSSGGDIIALGGITALGDLSQTVSAAAAMFSQCPELFDRGASLSVSPSGSDKESDKSHDSMDVDTDDYWTDQSTCEQLLQKHLQAVLGGSSSSSSSDGAALTVVLPLEVNIKVKILVKIPAGKDSQHLAAAAAAWLQSAGPEELLQQHGLHVGLGTPARLITVLPQKVTPVTLPDVTSFSNDTISGSWKHESAAAGTSGSSSGHANATLDVALEIPTATAAAAGSSRVISETETQMVVVIVVTVLGSAAIGAAGALGVMFRIRRRRHLAGSSGSSSSKAGSSGARRRRRTRGIVKRHSKYLPAGASIPPVSEAMSVLLLPAAASVTAAAAGEEPAGQPGAAAGQDLQQQRQQQQQGGVQQRHARPLATAAIPAAATGRASPGSSDGQGASSWQQQVHGSSVAASSILAAASDALLHVHSAPVAAAPGLSAAAPAAAPQLLAHRFSLQRYWSSGLAGIGSSSGYSSSAYSSGDVLRVTRSDLCSDSVSSAARLDLQQQQQPGFSRSSSRSSDRSSSIGEGDSDQPDQEQISSGSSSGAYSSSGGSSNNGGSIMSGNDSAVDRLAGVPDSTGAGISPFQLHYNFDALVE